MIAYLDTSALLKLLLLDEDGFDAVEAVWSGADEAITSRLAYPEGRAALAAAAREGRIPRQRLRAVARELDEVFRQLDVVELDRRVAEVAGEVAERLSLRAADAVHLASALAVAPPPGDGVFVTWDRRLARAAADTGLAVAPTLR